MKKRIFALVLAIAMLVSLIPITALADTGDVMVFNKAYKPFGYRIRVYTNTTGPGSTEGGYISNNRNTYLKYQDEWTFVAHANDGYQFDGWTTSGSPSDAYAISGTTLKVLDKGNHNYHAYAHFSFIGYSVTLDLGGGATFNDTGLSTKTLSGVYPGTISVPAYTVKPGYDLVGWDRSLDISGDATINAKYEYEVSFVGNTGVTITGGTPVWTSGHTAAEPSYTVASGYRFDGWDRSLSGITAPTTITAKPAVAQVALTVSSTSGGSLTAEGAVEGTYDVGDTVRLNKALPVPNLGWAFDGWIDDSSGINIGMDPTVTVLGNCSYTAKFIDVECLAVSPGEHGYLTTDLGGLYERGESVNLFDAGPTGYSGYEFYCWKELGGGWSEEFGFFNKDVPDPTNVIIGDQNIFWAFFKVAEYDIDTSVTGGTITPDQTVTHGDNCTITYSTDTGYHLVSVTVDGTDVTAGNEDSYTFSNVTADHTIDVVYAIDTYTITTTVTGGTITPDQTVDHGSNCTITYSPDAGYHLVSVTVDGTDVTAGNESSYTFSGVTANHTIDVVYEATTYTITYNLNGGTNDPSNPSIYTVEDAEIVLADPTKTGYDFAGWAPDDTIPAGSTGDKVFDAAWTPTAYTITYNLDGGTNDSSNPSTYTVEDAEIVLADPSKAGYDFAGWTPGDTIPAGSTGDKVFDAAWTPTEYTITYNLDGGTNDPSNPSTYTVEDAEIVLANPTKVGYGFAGWTPGDTIPAGSTGDKVFDASWTLDVYTITYNLDGGTNDPSNPSTYTVEDAEIVLADPSKAGYDFAGWTPGDTIPAGSTGDKVFDAAWTPTEYTIIYNLDGGTNNAANPATYTIEDAEIVLADPTRAGYGFDGWTPGDTIPAGSMGDKVFDAAWTPIVYTITYELNGGSVAGTNPATYTVESADITLINPTRAGYTFTGWDGTGIADGTDSVVVATGSTGNRSYSATWGINTYTVTFDDYDGTELGTDVVAYGDDAVPPADPTREGYTFAGWDRGFENVTRSFTVTATYTINTYTVTFEDYDGSVIDEQTVDWNEAATAPADPERDGYTFAGWDTSFDNVTADMTVTALYREVVVVEEEAVPAIQDTEDVDDEAVPKGASSTFPWWWIPIIGGAALLLFLILFFWKRRKKDEKEETA